jgi:hypothetical protein
MTVPYAQFTHTSAKIGVFFRVLGIWRGGIMKVSYRKISKICFILIDHLNGSHLVISCTAHLLFTCYFNADEVGLYN